MAAAKFNPWLNYKIYLIRIMGSLLLIYENLEQFFYSYLGLYAKTERSSILISSQAHNSLWVSRTAESVGFHQAHCQLLSHAPFVFKETGTSTQDIASPRCTARIEDSELYWDFSDHFNKTEFPCDQLLKSSVQFHDFDHYAMVSVRKLEKYISSLDSSIFLHFLLLSHWIPHENPVISDG